MFVDNKPTLQRRLKGLQEYFTLLMKSKLFINEVKTFFKPQNNNNSNNNLHMQRSFSLGSIFNEWIIDCSEIEKKERIGSGSFSDVYLGKVNFYILFYFILINLNFY